MVSVFATLGPVSGSSHQTRKKLTEAEAFATALSKRIGTGDLLAEGTFRFAEKLGRLSDADYLLRFPQWGYVQHWTLPGVQWAYGSLMDSRDINDHDMRVGRTDKMSCEEYVKMLSKETPPYSDPFMFDYGWQGEQAYKTGIYSEHKAKLIAWHRHYQTFYKESLLFCDLVFANLSNADRADGDGATPEAEPVFYNAVTGKNISFADGIEIGRKSWNLKRLEYRGRFPNAKNIGRSWP